MSITHRFRVLPCVFTLQLLTAFGCQSDNQLGENTGLVFSDYDASQFNTDWSEGSRSQLKSRIIEQLSTVRVLTDTFVMGCTDKDLSCFQIERPEHKVEMDTQLNVMSVEVTQRLYQTVTGKNPSLFNRCGLDCPVERVSWFDAVAFANAMSIALELKPCYLFSEGVVSWPDPLCKGWRLPTEAEWEYLASEKNGSRSTVQGSWFSDNSQGQTHPVAQQKPNAYGIHDMTGNVWEWTWDWIAEYDGHITRNPRGPQFGIQKVIRGGCWLSNERNIRPTVRDAIEPDMGAGTLGFRLVQLVK
ncbi:MAG: SUMF1/EgtB/PvdO family nonheme iron enzyme [Myxococcota bacterium]|nr:SUMF1/EgtB/PvdO family nonheme iron enzyme [Myxococcota bacterium]